jgi:hypothetical protein
VSAEPGFGWPQIRGVLNEAGLRDQCDSFEKELPGRLVTAVLSATATQDRYLGDGLYRSRVNTIIQIIVAELLQRGASVKTKDMEELSKIFQQEAQSWGR